ncbi:MAG: DUF3552 domain-containing protein, partial [Clostridia bacterium]|nr:DUF3552 domain-containing protein [Clostridia bacterium]
MQHINFGVLFLATNPSLWIGLFAGALVLAIALGVAFFFVLGNKAKSEKQVGDAKKQCASLIEEAKAEAERIKAQGKEESRRALKEGLLEVNEQDLKLRNEFERETKEKKAEIQRMEQRLTQ